MDFNKIIRFADNLDVDDNNIFQSYSSEIIKEMTSIKELYDCEFVTNYIEMRCECSDRLVEQGFTPAETLFLMEWSDCKMMWINYEYKYLSVDDQFA